MDSQETPLLLAALVEDVVVEILLRTEQVVLLEHLDKVIEVVTEVVVEQTHFVAVAVAEVLVLSVVIVGLQVAIILMGVLVGMVQLLQSQVLL